mmetsp:Transcript_91633/g.144882  ORF Transcript_91633/g.144882 Transcript_91633/m.144882 type:complete len:233 (-) Transcript_91633:124-822(-)
MQSATSSLTRLAYEPVSRIACMASFSYGGNLSSASSLATSSSRHHANISSEMSLAIHAEKASRSIVIEEAGAASSREDGLNKFTMTMPVAWWTFCPQRRWKSSFNGKPLDMSLASSPQNAAPANCCQILLPIVPRCWTSSSFVKASTLACNSAFLSLKAAFSSESRSASLVASVSSLWVSKNSFKMLWLSKRISFFAICLYSLTRHEAVPVSTKYFLNSFMSASRSFSVSSG